MPVEWIAQTDSLVCANCKKNFNEGDVVVGDMDEVYHKEKEDCETEE